MAAPKRHRPNLETLELLESSRFSYDYCFRTVDNMFGGLPESEATSQYQYACDTRRGSHGLETSQIKQYMPATIPVLRPGTPEDAGSWVCKFCFRSNFNEFRVCLFCQPENSDQPNYHANMCRSFQQHNEGYSMKNEPYEYHHQSPVSSYTNTIKPRIQRLHHSGADMHHLTSEDMGRSYIEGLHMPLPTHSTPSSVSQRHVISQSSAQIPSDSLRPPGQPKTKRPCTRSGFRQNNNKQAKDDHLTHAVAYLEANDLSRTFVDGTPVPPHRNLLVDPDRLLLTDYMHYLMKQLRYCQFTERDRKTRGGKRQTVPVGFGGLQCVHCARQAKPRKFFWSHADRLSNSFAEIPSHILKCGACPKEIQEALCVLKARHQDQMQLLARGSQKIYFRRMWNRIQEVGQPEIQQDIPNGEESNMVQRQDQVVTTRISAKI